MYKGIAVALAWPATWCKQTGSWYDQPLQLLGINNRGYYQVGHAALVLADPANGTCQYFDFGRYHAPHGLGRIRSGRTDHDLIINTPLRIDAGKPNNEDLNLLLEELSQNPSTHGDGKLYAAWTEVDVISCQDKLQKMMESNFIAYGPFVRPGTNCSRFVNTILLAGTTDPFTRVRLAFPPMLTPTPMWNVMALGNMVKREVALEPVIIRNLKSPQNR